MQRTLALLFGTLLATQAAAHVTVEPTQAQRGAYTRVTLRVPHGCGGAATLRLVVHLPESAPAARPMPKPGWELSIARQPLATPASTGHGNTVTDRIAEIAWQGNLPDAQYDEFVLMLRMPEQGDTLTLPVTQFCERGRKTEWTEIPTAGQHADDLNAPAPAIRLAPAQ